MIARDRGVSNPLAYTMTLAITAVFVLALMTSAGGMLSDQREHATESDLRTIGNRLATDIAAVDSMAGSGANVSITSDQPARVAGSQYHAVIETGAECDRTRFQSDSCLRLWAENPDATAYVPLHNDSAISMTAGDDGTVTLSADNASLTRERTLGDPPITDTGIASGANLSAPFDVTENHAPVAKVTLNRTNPRQGQTVKFNASGSFDSDGIIDFYHWDWEADGSIDATTTDPVKNHTFSSAGHSNVTLTVEDDDGANTTTTRTLQVYGLVYNDDLQRIPPPSSPENGDIEFTVTNTYSSKVNITTVLINPEDDTIDQLKPGPSTEFCVDCSVDIKGPPPTMTTIAAWQHGGVLTNDKINVYSGGRILSLQAAPLNPALKPLVSGGTATVKIGQFNDSSTPPPENVVNDEITIALKYDVQSRINGTKNTNTTTIRINDTVDP